MSKQFIINQKLINPYEGREGLAYTRVSSKKQETEGSGLISQEGRCIKELKALNVPHIKTFSDSYTGGGDFMKRPSMRGLLAYIDEHPHKKYVVIFDDLKRFARDVKFHLELKIAFQKRGVILKCLNYEFDNSAEGQFVETILAAQNELERKQGRRQVVQKQKARLELGYWAFVSKRGYKQTKDKIHGTLSIPTKKGLEILKPALEDFATGKLLRKIDVCKFLIDKGFWKEKRPEKCIDDLTEILIDPFYAGYVEYLRPGWEVTRRKGRHEAIISIETFELIQKRLKNNGIYKSIRKDNSKDFKLRGLVICGECNGHLTAGWYKKAKYPYYHCQNIKCSQFKKSIRRKDIEDRFDELLKNTNLKIDVTKVIELIFDRVWKQEVQSLKENESMTIRKRNDLSDKMQQLTNMAFEAKSASLRNAYEMQIEKTMQELENIDDQSLLDIDYNIPYRTALDKAVGLLKSPYSYWHKLTLQEQHELFFFIYESKLPYDKKEGYQTSKIQSYSGLFEDFVTTNSSSVDPRGFEPPTFALQKHCSTN